MMTKNDEKPKRAKLNLKFVIFGWAVVGAAVGLTITAYLTGNFTGDIRKPLIVYGLLAAAFPVYAVIDKHQKQKGDDEK